jgi:O-antigen ligase
LFGYVFIAAFSSILFPLGVASPLAILFRISIVLFSVAYFFKNIGGLTNFKENRISKLNLMCFIIYISFWVYYFLRFFIDITTENVPSNIVDSYLVLALFFCFIPSLGMTKAVTNEDMVIIVRYSFYIVFFGLVFSLYTAVNDFMNGLSAEHSRLSLSRLSPIQIGKYSVFLFFLSVGLLTFRNNSKLQKTLYFLAIFIAVFSVFLSGSRTAFVGLFFLLVVNVLFNMHLYKAIITILVVPIFLYLSSLVVYLLLPEVDLINRYMSMGGSADESANTRYELYSGAFEQFSNHPIFGDLFIERVFMYAPHNLYLEIMMSMGMVGFSTFLFLLFFSLYKFIRCIRIADQNAKRVYLVFFNIYSYLLIAGVFSLGITTASELWALMVLSFFLPKRQSNV